MEIHYSEISTYLKCKNLHNLSYIENITRRFLPVRMLFGTYGHIALEYLFTDRESEALPAVLKAAEKEESGLSDEDIEANQKLARDAYEVATMAWHGMRDRIEVVSINGKPAAEIPLVVVEDGLKFVGTADAIVLDKQTGSTLILDYKFRKTFRNTESEYLNLQMIMYYYMAKKNGIKVDGTAQLQIKSCAPKEPQLTLKGKVSKADILTTWEKYLEYLVLRGENPEEYQDMRDKFSKHVWFDMDSTKILRQDAMVTSVWENQILPVAKEIRANLRRKDRLFDWMHCQNCNLKEFCIEEMNNGDTEFLLKTKFKRKNENSKFEVEFEDESDHL